VSKSWSSSHGVSSPIDVWTVTTASTVKHTTAAVRRRSTVATLSDGHDMVNVSQNHIIRMNRVGIEHVPTSISGWAPSHGIDERVHETRA
jgi:hypothetical protein